jgi:hypothetical protein
MTPVKLKTVRGHLVEQFFWNGKPVVYVDGMQSEDKFSVACDRIEAAYDAIERMPKKEIPECPKK